MTNGCTIDPPAKSRGRVPIVRGASATRLTGIRKAKEVAARPGVDASHRSPYYNKPTQGRSYGTSTPLPKAFVTSHHRLQRPHPPGANIDPATLTPWPKFQLVGVK